MKSAIPFKLRRNRGSDRTGQETARAKARYDRIARFYDLMETLVETRLFKRYREETLENLEGDILEIGVGTGKNLPFYSSKARVTAIDISPRMMKGAKVRASSVNPQVHLQLMDAEHLEFPDRSFDYVVGTFVLCSIPDPVGALREMKRVVRKDGKILFVEHVLSKRRAVAIIENLINPLVRMLFGFNVNRDTRSNIEKAGLFVNVDEELAMGDVFRRFTCARSAQEEEARL